MENKTREWLSYTDRLLAEGGAAAKEVNTVMAAQRGPDYVRKRGGEVSPAEADRLAAKKVTTAIIRAAAFPLAAKAAQSGGKLGKFLQENLSFSADEAKAAVKTLLPNFSNWVVNPGGVIPEGLLTNDLGNKSHFVIKVRKAAAVLGLSIR